jgi:hypothetical protein
LQISLLPTEFTKTFANEILHVQLETT